MEKLITKIPFSRPINISFDEIIKCLEQIDNEFNFIQTDDQKLDTLNKLFAIHLPYFKSIGSSSRKREIVQDRQICHYLVKEKTKISLSEIGLKFGNKDHTTVIHSIKTINNLKDIDPYFKLKIGIIKKEFKAYN